MKGLKLFEIMTSLSNFPDGLKIGQNAGPVVLLKSGFRNTAGKS